MGKVFLRCHQMKYYDRVDWNLPKTQDWEKVLAVLYPSLGTLGLSFPIHKKAVGWGLGYSIPKDLEALTFPVSMTIGKSSKQKKIPVVRSCLWDPPSQQQAGSDISGLPELAQSRLEYMAQDDCSSGLDRAMLA